MANLIKRREELIAEGKNPVNSVAVQPSTAAIYKDIRRRIKIPPIVLNNNCAEYHFELAEGGNKIYSAFPLIGEITIGKIEFEQSRDDARYLAFWQSAEGKFKELTGIDAYLPDIITATSIVWPERTETFFSETKFPNTINEGNLYDEANFNNYRELRTYLNRRKRTLRPEWLDFEGVLIYFGQKLKEAAEIIPVEDGTELVIRSKKNLPVSLISGIEILGKADEKYLAAI